ncbi:MAG: GHKL domain-containing protein [Nitrospirales bacterium]|nr:GHKL domain-containing protein [Nitrospirales bacterium]
MNQDKRLSSHATKQSTLQKTLTAVVNELGMDSAVAIRTHEEGPFIPQVSRGLSDREVRAIFRSLSHEEWKIEKSSSQKNTPVLQQAIRLRMITPGSKVLLASPLRHGPLVYGALVLARKEGSHFSKRDKTSIETARTTITEELRQARLFDSTAILSRVAVQQEPEKPLPQEQGAQDLPSTYTNPEVEGQIVDLLNESREVLAFDRGWVTLYDPIAASLEILGCVAGHKKELLPGHRLLLDQSASGWSVRHRKPRIDQNLASTQGRFLDYKQLYRERFKCTMIVPFFVRGRVAGTITLATKTAALYESADTDARRLEGLSTKLAKLFEDPSLKLSLFAAPDATRQESTVSQEEESQEPTIRRQERQSALNEVSSFLAAEIREPLGYVRAQMEEITGEGSLDHEAQTRVETAMRDLIRIETLLHEILDFAKPLKLERRLCRVPKLLDHALSLIQTDLVATRIEVTKSYAARLAQVRWDEVKMQHVFLCIFQNALDAMSSEGHLQITVTAKRGKQPEIVISIHNNGIPIPAEHADKIFEPYFTTKRSGTGLGLATVKKIVEEHQGHIAIESQPDHGTTVTLHLPALRPRIPHRRRGKPRSAKPAASEDKSPS